MIRGNISRKVAASVMTGAMMVSMAGMSVCAAPIVGDGDHAIEAVPVQKTVATDGHTHRIHPLASEWQMAEKEPLRAMWSVPV